MAGADPATENHLTPEKVNITNARNLRVATGPHPSFSPSPSFHLPFLQPFFLLSLSSHPHPSTSLSQCLRHLSHTTHMMKGRCDAHRDPLSTPMSGFNRVCHSLPRSRQKSAVLTCNPISLGKQSTRALLDNSPLCCSCWSLNAEGVTTQTTSTPHPSRRFLDNSQTPGFAGRRATVHTSIPHALAEIIVSGLQRGVRTTDMTRQTSTVDSGVTFVHTRPLIPLVITSFTSVFL